MGRYAYPILTVAFAAGAVTCQAPPDENSDAESRLAAFTDDFVAREESERASDLSAASFASELEETRRLLEQLREIDPTELSTDDRIDGRFAESILRGREIEQAEIQPWKKDPRAYMRFRPIPQTIGRPGDMSEKADELLRLLRAVPAQLENGQKNLSVYIPRFQELSVFMAEGAFGLFDNEVPRFASDVPDHEEALLAANAESRDALERFVDFLKDELPKREEGHWAIGAETYDQILKDQFMLPYDSDALFEYGMQEFSRTTKEMEEVAERIDPSKTWQELAVEIKNDYPEPNEMIEAHQEWVDKAKAHILAKDLVPIPWNERADVVPRAEYLRRTSYYGNFSRARGADENGVFVAQWMINPFEDQWDEKTKQEYLVEHDYGVIIVTAPHETYSGHHIQGLYQMHNPSKLRREFGTPIFSEGWGLYNEQLLRETGFFPDDRIVLRHLQLRLWRNARVVWDVGIHTGKMTYEDAVSLLADQVGFLRWAAQLEIDGSTQRPGYRIGYFMGMSEILKMRDELKERRGDRFSLSDFHERLLKVGNMPPALMREGLMASLGPEEES